MEELKKLLLSILQEVSHADEKAMTVTELSEHFQCSKTRILEVLRMPDSPGMKTGAGERSEWRAYPSEMAQYMKDLAKGSKAS